MNFEDFIVIVNNFTCNVVCSPVLSCFNECADAARDSACMLATINIVYICPQEC